MTHPPDDHITHVPEVLSPSSRVASTWSQKGGWVTEWAPRPIPRPELPRRFGCLGWIHRSALASWFTAAQVEHGVAPGGQLRAVARITGRVLALMIAVWVVMTMALPIVVAATAIVFQIMMAAIYLAVTVLILVALFRMRGR